MMLEKKREKKDQFDAVNSSLSTFDYSHLCSECSGPLINHLYIDALSERR